MSSLVFSDSFSGTDGTPITAHLPEVGTGWAVDATNTASLVVSGGCLAIDGAPNGYNRAFTLDEVEGTTYELEVDLQLASGSDPANNDWVLIECQCGTGVQRWYRVSLQRWLSFIYYEVFATSVGTIRTSTILGSVDTNQHLLRVEKDGVSFRLYWDGVLKFDHTASLARNEPGWFTVGPLDSPTTPTNQLKVLGFRAYGAAYVPALPPAAPGSLSAVAGDGAVTLTWSSAAGATSYTLYRGASTGVTPATADQVLPSVTSPYTETGRANGVPLYYVVTASNAYGQSPASAEATATPQAAVVPPAAPGNLAAAAGDGAVTLTWSSAAGATSYTLYRGASTGVTPATADQVLPSVTSPYTETGRANGVPLYYVVTASNAYGQSPASAEATATPQAVVAHDPGSFWPTRFWQVLRPRWWPRNYWPGVQEADSDVEPPAPPVVYVPAPRRRTEAAVAALPAGAILYRTREGDTADLIAWGYYGTSDAAEVLLEANPGLAAWGPVLPAGLTVVLPVLPAVPERGAPRLWDEAPTVAALEARAAPEATAAPSRYRTREGDTADAIAWDHYGRDEVVAVLAANPGLAAWGPVLPAGLTLVLPVVDAEAPAALVLWR